VAPNPNAAADYAAVKNLQPGHWYEVLNSRMKAVGPCPGVHCFPHHNNQDGLIRVWSGGAYDWDTDKLLVFGGGHLDYWGNEVYAFSVTPTTMHWERLTNPSQLMTSATYGTVPWLTDNGSPHPIHTYDGVEYVPEIQSFCQFGNTGNNRFQTACLDMNQISTTTYQWSRRANVNNLTNATANSGGEPPQDFRTAYDPVTKSIWRRGGAHYAYFSSYDAKADIWTRHGGEDGQYTHCGTAAIDPMRRLFVGVGSGNVWVWNMDAGPYTPTLQPTTGGPALLKSLAPGFEYDPVIRKLVAWNGFADIYTLDTNTWAWKLVPPAPTNTVIPPRAGYFDSSTGGWVNNGTYGRFRYIPRLDRYIVVNNNTENVYFYRMATGQGGGNPPPPPPQRPTGLRVR
jgi:hypothetical protein